jgi:hypothetical protein
MPEKRRGPAVQPEPPPPRSGFVAGVRLLGTAAFMAVAFLLGAWVGAVFAAGGVPAAAVGALSALGAFLLVQALLSRPNASNHS